MARRFHERLCTALSLTVLASLAPQTATHLLAQQSSEVSLTVEIAGIDGELKRNVEALAGIFRAARSKTVRPGHVYRLFENAPEEIERALQPFGFYHPAIESSLDVESSPWRATFVVDSGPPTLVDRLDIRVIGFEQLLRTILGQFLYQVCHLLAFVVALAGISFSILVGQTASAGHHNSLGNIIFGRDKANRPALARGFLLDKLVYLRVILLKSRCHFNHSTGHYF